jgi:hypothetical protein
MCGLLSGFHATLLTLDLTSHDPNLQTTKASMSQLPRKAMQSKLQESQLQVA